MHTDNPFMLEDERDFGEKINASFRYLSLNFNQLMGIIFRFCGPLIIATLLSGSLLTYKVWDFSGPDAGSQLFSRFNMIYLALLYLLFFTVIMLINFLIQIAVYGYMKIQIENNGQQVSYTAAWHLLKTKLFKLIVYNILITLIIISGYVFLILPGIFLHIVLSLFMPVYIVEEEGFRLSFSRCFQLMKNNWWETFGFIIVMGLLSWVGSYVVYTPYMVVFVGAMTSDYLQGFLPLILASGVLLYAAYWILATTLYNIAIGLQYFHLREKNDSYGLRKMVDRIGQPIDINGFHR